jgi:hypothetical protein
MLALVQAQSTRMRRVALLEATHISCRAIETNLISFPRRDRSHTKSWVIRWHKHMALAITPTGLKPPPVVVDLAHHLTIFKRIPTRAIVTPHLNMCFSQSPSTSKLSFSATVHLLTPKASTCLAGSPRNALSEKMALSWVMQPILIRASSVTTTKTASASFSTSCNLLQKKT